MFNIIKTPLYVAEEHRKILADAKDGVRDYEKTLMEQIESTLSNGSIRPSQRQLARAQKMYFEDPLRQQLLNHLIAIKTLVERPQFILGPDPSLTIQVVPYA